MILSKSYEKEILEIVSKLTLDEKISMIHGAGLFHTGSVERLGLPCVKMSDGPMGVRKEFADGNWVPIGTTDDYTAYLPSNSAMASTWNRDLAYLTGKTLGAQARGRGKDVILSPGINIKRSPLCGRNFEYMSEDPYLISEMVIPEIKGIQENDVAACVKHFAANGQELGRLGVDTYIDERALREIYLPGFKAAAVDADSYSIMAAYNAFRGSLCCENQYLLNTVLRDEWDYDGVVVSDWGGVKSTVATALSSLDIEMSVFDNFDDYFLANPLKQAVAIGDVPEKIIDEKIKNILRMMYRLKMIGPKADSRQKGCYHSFEHIQNILNTARESIILLKNDEHRLPLSPSKKLAVIGYNAACIHSDGGGSAEIKALYEVSPLLGIKNILGGNTDVKYAMGYPVPEIKRRRNISWQDAAALTDDEITKVSFSDEDVAVARKKQCDPSLVKRLREEAVKLASECEDAVIICGLNHMYDVEGQDREDMKLPFMQDELINAVLDVNPNTVVVVIAGSPVEMPWASRAKSIVWCYYAGMETGTALAEVLMGEINPSGKLAESFPYKATDCNAIRLGEFAKADRLDYTDGIYVGYRYYNTNNVPVQYPFGHGLSYTDYEYGNPVITQNNDGKVALDVPVKNTGAIAGKETVQLYISPINNKVDRPSLELKEFDKKEILPDKTVVFHFELNIDSFKYYDETEGGWRLDNHDFNLLIGASSEDIRCRCKVSI